MIQSQQIPFIGLIGPTAVGKTELSLRIAESLNGEIVSADSMQVYQHMDIGTAKLPLEQRRGIPHYMIDVVEPTVSYTVHDYALAARKHILDIYHRGKVPIVVGGTGLYFRSITEEFDFTQTDRDDAMRLDLEQVALKEGSIRLHQMLMEKDPERAAQIHYNDKRRLIRALEIVHQTGRPVKESYLQRESQFDPILIGLNDDRERLYRRIDARVDHMMNEGLLNEVKGLLELGCKEGNASMQAIGYKELVDFLYQRSTLETAVDDIKKASRRYAKRQISWFRADNRIWWYHLQEDGMMEIPYLLEEINLFWQNKVID